MKYFSIITIVLFCNCCRGGNNNSIKNLNTKEAHLVASFESDLEKLDRSKVESIDSATFLFKKYQKKAKNLNEVDSLFSPYFNMYNIGRGLLIDAPDSTIEKYGFNKLIYSEKIYIIPQKCAYLDDNIILFLSKPMQKFTTQQLTEFGPKTIQNKGDYTIWWENFNNNYPTFFLNEMAEYHYKFWHLKNLLNSAFNKNGGVKTDIIVEYERLIQNYPNSNTAGVLRKYLATIEKSNNIKGLEVNEFLKEFEPK